MKSILYTQEFYLLKNSKAYFGHVQQHNHVCKPLVFAFTKSKHAEIVRQTLRINPCDVEQYADSIFKVTPADIFESPCIIPQEGIDIECHSFFDVQIHLSMNNVEMFIVDSITEADDACVYMVQGKNDIKPLFINEDMRRLHLTRLLNTEDSTEPLDL